MFEIIGILLTIFFMNGCQTSDQDDDVATDDAAAVAAFLLAMVLMISGKKEEEKEKEKEKEREWKLTTIDGHGDKFTIKLPSLAVDSKDKLHVIYNVQVGSAALKYTTYDDGSSLWSTPISVVGGGPPMALGTNPSLAVDSEDKLHVIFYQNEVSRLKYATYDDGSSSWTTPVTVDSSATSALGYDGISLAIDSEDKLHVTYNDYTNGKIKYATYDATLGIWGTPTTVDSNGNGQYSSLAIDTKDKLHVTYYDLTKDELKYTTYDTTTSSWDTPTTLDSNDTVLEINLPWDPFHPAAMADEQGYSSLVVDSKDNLHVTYRACPPTAHLKYATYDTAAGRWSNPTTVDSSGDVGLWNSLAIDTKDKLHVTYFDATNAELKYATSDDGSSLWSTPTTVDSPGEKWGTSSLVTDSKDNLHVAYNEKIKGEIKYAVFS